MVLTIQVDNGTGLDDKVANSLKEHDGPVRIVGLCSLCDDDAKALSCHTGELHLVDLITLSKTAAAFLSTHGGALYLDSLQRISDDGLAVLSRHPSLSVPQYIRDRIERLERSNLDGAVEKNGVDRTEDSACSDHRAGGNENAHVPTAGRRDAAESWHRTARREENDDRQSTEHDDGAKGRNTMNRAAHDPRTHVPDEHGTSLDALLRPLDQLVGLEDVKRTVRSVVSLARVTAERRRSGLSVAPASYHMAFFGPPGTGKTTVARLVAAILREAGVLARGHLVETDGQGLVAKYLGQTGHRVKEIVERSLGGVLFIDEAYSLIPRDGGAGAYAAEAIATLIPLLETYREDLVVILAGYEEEMNELFASNPGLRSRVVHHMVFPPMEIDELQKVYERLASEHGYLMSTQFKTGVRYAIDRERRIRGKRFANARAIRTLFEATLRKQAERLAAVTSPTVIELQTLLMEDLPEWVA